MQMHDFVNICTGKIMLELNEQIKLCKHTVRLTSNVTCEYIQRAFYGE